MWLLWLSGSVILLIVVILILLAWALWAVADRIDCVDRKVGRTACQVSKSSKCMKHETQSIRQSLSTQSCEMATAGFSTTDSATWYTIMVPAFPAAVRMSLNRNYFKRVGCAVPIDVGLKIKVPGHYIAFGQAIIFVEAAEAFIPVFLVKNGRFEPDLTKPTSVVGPGRPLLFGIATTVAMSPGHVVMNGPVYHLCQGDTLSLMATNGTGDVVPQAVSLIAWNIEITRIPCLGCSQCREYSSSSSSSSTPPSPYYSSPTGMFSLPL